MSNSKIQERAKELESKRKRTENINTINGLYRSWQERAPTINQKRYRLDTVIGEGTYGLVHRGFDNKINRKIAVKQMDNDTDKYGLPSVALREAAILGELEHINLVSLLEIIIGSKHLMFIFEFLDMDLREFQNQKIEKLGRLPLELVRNLTYQLFSGLNYVHDRKLIHRDMKPQNVLIDLKTNIVKIADFGLARMQTTPVRAMTNEVVTLWYRCPELLLGADLYTTSVDIWSLGVMIIELVENSSPFEPDSEIRGLHLIFQSLGTPDSTYWHDIENQKFFCDAFPKWEPKPWREITPHSSSLVIDLLKKMLVYDPARRITCKQAMAHAVFDAENGSDIRSYCHKLNLELPRCPLHPRDMDRVGPHRSDQQKSLPAQMQKIVTWETELLRRDREKFQQERALSSAENASSDYSHPASSKKTAVVRSESGYESHEENCDNVVNESKELECVKDFEKFQIRHGRKIPATTPPARKSPAETEKFMQVLRLVERLASKKQL